MTDINETQKVQIFHGKVRIFRGDESKQIDSSGNRADPEKWYYEPSDYDGDVLWSKGYGSRVEAYQAAGCSTE